MVEYPISSDIVITTVDQLLEAVNDGEIHEDVAHKILNDNIAKLTAFIKDVPNQSWERGNRDWTGRKFDVLRPDDTDIGWLECFLQQCWSVQRYLYRIETKQCCNED